MNDNKDRELKDVENENGIVSIKHLYGNQQKIQDTQIEILTTLNNGLQKEVKKNSKTISQLDEKIEDKTDNLDGKIDCLDNKFDNLDKRIEAKESYEEGKWGFIISARELIAWALATALGLMKIAELL